jgi:hypothetical protein
MKGKDAKSRLLERQRENEQTLRGIRSSSSLDIAGSDTRNRPSLVGKGCREGQLYDRGTEYPHMRSSNHPNSRQKSKYSSGRPSTVFCSSSVVGTATWSPSTARLFGKSFDCSRLLTDWRARCDARWTCLQIQMSYRRAPSLLWRTPRTRHDTPLLHRFALTQDRSQGDYATPSFAYALESSMPLPSAGSLMLPISAAASGGLTPPQTSSNRSITPVSHASSLGSPDLESARKFHSIPERRSSNEKQPVRYVRECDIV